jgi:hypothetical protein
MQHRAGDGWGDRRAEIAAWMAGDGIDRVRVSMRDALESLGVEESGA